MKNFECNEKEFILANAVANYWIEKKLPSSKQATLDKELQEFKTALIKKLLNEKPRIINNGNIYFKDLPYAPKFPWETWTYIDWKTFVFGTKGERITTLTNTN